MHKLVLSLVVALLSVAAHAQEPATKPTLQDFAWLAGHWRMEQGDNRLDEQWMAPAAGLMMGMDEYQWSQIANSCASALNTGRFAAEKQLM